MLLRMPYGDNNHLAPFLHLRERMQKELATFSLN